MTKADLAERVYDRHGRLTKSQAAELVDIVLERMKARLAGREKVLVSNFGSFRVISARARRGRNPATGETIQIPSRETLVFRPAPAFITLLNSGTRSQKRN